MELTESGTAVLDVFTAIIRSRIRPALAALSAGDRESLVAILDTLTEALAHHGAGA